MGSSRSKIFKDQTSDLPPSEKSVVLLSSVCPNHLPTLWERCDRAIVFQKFLLADFKLTRSRPTHSEQSRAHTVNDFEQTCLQRMCPSSVHVLHWSTCHCTRRRKDVSRISREPSRHTCLATTGNRKKSVASNRNGRRKIPNNHPAQTRKRTDTEKTSSSFFLKKNRQTRIQME